MHKKLILAVLVVSVAAALASCGEAVPAEKSHTAVFVPVFDEQGFVCRDPLTDLPLYEAAESDAPQGLTPMFLEDGGVRRCPETDCPLYLAEGKIVRLSR